MRQFNKEVDESMLDEDGYIPTPGIKEVCKVTVYYFYSDDVKRKHLFGSFKTIWEAQDKMKAAVNMGLVYGNTLGGKKLDHWLLHWIDQDHANHYQKYRPDFSNMFCYGDDYAYACNHENPETGEMRSLAYKVDPPIGEIPDAMN